MKQYKEFYNFTLHLDCSAVIIINKDDMWEPFLVLIKNSLNIIKKKKKKRLNDLLLCGRMHINDILNDLPHAYNKNHNYYMLIISKILCGMIDTYTTICNIVIPNTF